MVMMGEVFQGSPTGDNQSLAKQQILGNSSGLSRFERVLPPSLFSRAVGDKF